MPNTITINNRVIGPDSPTYLIAELSANHGNSLAQAREMVQAAAESGADAVKLQTFTAETMTLNSNRPEFLIRGGLWDGRNLYELYEEAHTPWEWHSELQELAHASGLDFFSTPYDKTAADFLHELNVPAFKIASFELVDLPLIEYVARLGKPLIMSTGMATLEEIEKAVKTARENGTQEIALLKCTSSYPAPVKDANLRTIPHLSETFDVIAGLSDHTLGISVPIASVALGGRIIEKHFCLSRDSPGLDTEFSLTPESFRLMANSIREAEESLGSVSYGMTESQELGKKYRRSLYAARTIPAGEELTEENIRSIRPGNGLAPEYLPQILGKVASVTINAHTPLEWDMIQKD